MEELRNTQKEREELEEAVKRLSDEDCLVLIRFLEELER